MASSSGKFSNGAERKVRRISNAVCRIARLSKQQPWHPHCEAQRVMPQISTFFGITIFMFYTEHGVPHFHADYAGQQASIEINSGLVRGRLPPTASRLIIEWLDLHRSELLE